MLKDKGGLSLYASFTFRRYLCSSVCMRWINNWNKRDVDSVVSRYSNDCVFESPITAKIFGRSVIRGSDPILLKPATKARQGTNPFNGEPMMFKAKPARKIVGARPVKAAKDAV